MGGSGCGKSTLLRHLIGLEETLERLFRQATSERELMHSLKNIVIFLGFACLYVPGCMNLSLMPDWSRFFTLMLLPETEQWRLRGTEKITAQFDFLATIANGSLHARLKTILIFRKTISFCHRISGCFSAMPGSSDIPGKPANALHVKS
jgi:energy-coupling factor transporter ATP-binding protein EcfA2